MYSDIRHFKGLNALRFFAAYLVLIHHLEQIRLKNSLFNFKEYSFFNNGGLAVSFFFVLSGFLITYLLLKEFDERGLINIKYFKSFLGRGEIANKLLKSGDIGDNLIGKYTAKALLEINEIVQSQDRADYSDVIYDISYRSICADLNEVEFFDKSYLQFVKFDDNKDIVSAKNITDEIYIGSRLHSNPGQKEAGLSSGILVGPRRQVNLGLEYNF